MKVIVISSSTNFEKEHDIVTRLFECGLETFHLRKPKLSTREMEEYINLIPLHFRNRIVIHSHHSLALKFQLKGIHITRVHKKKRAKLWLILKLLKVKRPGSIVSSSFRKLSDLYEEQPGKCTYSFLSPIFDSLSGKFQSGFNEQSLRVAIQKTHHKIIARGGITEEKIVALKTLGFEGVALYSMLWKKSDPVKEFISFCKSMEAQGLNLE